MKPLPISILIPTKNRRDSLKQYFNSLKKQSFKDFEVVLGDGASTDGTAQLVEEYRKFFPITVIQAKPGLVAATNAALSGAKGDIIIRTDDDIEVSKEWLKEIYETFKRDPHIGGVTGPTIILEEYQSSRDLFAYRRILEKGNILWRLAGKFYDSYLLENKPYALGKMFRSGAFSIGSNYADVIKHVDHCFECDYLEACNMSLRRNLVLQVGCFDPSFIGVGEFNEMDVIFKIKKLGYAMVYNPKALVWHKPSKGGVFKARPASYSRMLNYLTFYFRHIKPNTADKFARFMAYVAFLNTFWFYKFLTTGQIRQLGSFPATIVGFSLEVGRLLKGKPSL